MPVISTIWLGQLVTEWMIEKGARPIISSSDAITSAVTSPPASPAGGLPYFEDLAIRRSRLLYDIIDNSGGFYRTFVTDERFRSRMQVARIVRRDIREDSVRSRHAISS